MPLAEIKGFPVSLRTPSGLTATLSPDEEIAAFKRGLERAIEQRVLEEFTSRTEPSKALWNVIGMALGIAIGSVLATWIVSRGHHK
jgi:hypothetical protein